MIALEFVNHYEVLELSNNANSETIERVFRYHAKKIHPDVTKDAEPERFKRLIEAFETLRDPETRAAYDAKLEARQHENQEIVQGANEAENDCAERAKILSVFYAKRRRDMKNPGVSTGRLEDVTHCPSEVMEFHLWYFHKKGWIEREESGLMSITVECVDRIEEIYGSKTESTIPRIEYQSQQRVKETC